MGAIQRKGNGPTLQLRQPFVIGRAGGCELQLSVSSVSSHHAAIRWDGVSWGIVDLGSRNGTFLNGRRLSGSSRNLQPLSRDDQVTFAEADESWVLVDDAPPQPLLTAEDGSAVLMLRETEVLAFPDETNPIGYLYFERGSWHYEDRQGAVLGLKAGERVMLGGKLFNLYLPDSAQQTASAQKPILELSLSKLWLEIEVTENEEAAGVRVRLGSECFELPARIHLYILAYLARSRLAARDADPLLEPTQGGWIAVQDACRQLAIAPEALGVTVYRCRKDFERAGFPEASRIIDREKRGYLRIGVPAARLLVTQFRSAG